MGYACKICLKEKKIFGCTKEDDYLRHLKNQHNINISKQDFTLLMMGDE